MTGLPTRRRPRPSDQAASIPIRFAGRFSTAKKEKSRSAAQGRPGRAIRVGIASWRAGLRLHPQWTMACANPAGNEMTHANRFAMILSMYRGGGVVSQRPFVKGLASGGSREFFLAPGPRRDYDWGLRKPSAPPSLPAATHRTPAIPSRRDGPPDLQGPGANP